MTEYIKALSAAELSLTVLPALHRFILSLRMVCLRGNWRVVRRFHFAFRFFGKDGGYPSIPKAEKWTLTLRGRGLTTTICLITKHVILQPSGFQGAKMCCIICWGNLQGAVARQEGCQFFALPMEYQAISALAVRCCTPCRDSRPSRRCASERQRSRTQSPTSGFRVSEGRRCRRNRLSPCRP